MSSTVCTTCPYCGVGCGVLATPDEHGGVEIKGDPTHPANFGRLCSKGSALDETVGTEGRLLTPRIAGRSGSWDQAFDLVAGKFRETIDQHGPDSVAFYVSGQLLTEDYYVANKLMKGFIGSANIDTNSRLCMASSVAGHRRAFGTDTVPGTYEDLEEADLIVLVGSNLAWCHPVLHQRILAAKAKRPVTIVTVDPRRTATAETSDLHLAIAQGSDVALFNGLLNRIAAEGAITDYAIRQVNGLGDTLMAVQDMSLDHAAAVTGVESNLLDQFYSLWTGTEKVVTVYSQGVNQSSAGTDKVNAIINCHLATGRIGRAGMGPFSVTGQPNAMGGREVGGLANMLAAHMEIENSDHRSLVQGFWNAPTIPKQTGLKAVDMFDACATGQIKALWIMCTNPAVSMPRANHVAEAIRNCDFTVVSDIVETDTTALADVVLPATGWGEKSGTVTNSERRISRQRAFLPPPGEARHDWQIICDVAARMGYCAAFDFATPDEIFAEHVALSTLAAKQGLDFDLSGLAGADYDNLPPTQWPVNDGRTGGRFFAEGGYFTPDGKARMVPVTPKRSVNSVSREYPLILNTGRIRDQWHTMTRTAKSAKLSRHMAEPFVELHPDDAEVAGIAAAELMQVESPYGQIIARALITERTPKGTVFAPMHWTSQWASKARTDSVVAPVTDPISGQPELKRTAVKIEKVDIAWYGFAITRAELMPTTDYWARAKVNGGWIAELAGMSPLEDSESLLKSLAGAPDADVITIADKARGGERVALVKNGQLLAVLFTSNQPVAVARNFVAEIFGEPFTPDILAGQPSLGRPDPGATVCSCFGVGINTVRDAILTQRLTSVDEIGKVLEAGTNCGSCKPELQSLLANTDMPLAAE